MTPAERAAAFFAAPIPCGTPQVADDPTPEPLTEPHDWIDVAHGTALTRGWPFRFCARCDREERANRTTLPGPLPRACCPWPILPVDADPVHAYGDPTFVTACGRVNGAGVRCDSRPAQVTCAPCRAASEPLAKCGVCTALVEPEDHAQHEATCGGDLRL